HLRKHCRLLPLQAGEFCAAEQKDITTPTLNSNLKLRASTCAFSVPFVLTCRSGNRRVSFYLLLQQQTTLASPHGLPKYHLRGCDTSLGLSFPSIRFHCLEQPL